MGQCNSVRKDLKRCNRNCFLFSRYCWQHQDFSVKIGIALGIIGIFATIGVAIFQERNPDLHVSCELTNPNSPASVKCTIYNSGRGEATNVSIGFSEQLIVGTDVRSESYLGIRLEKSLALPNPLQDPEYSKTQKAFTIIIPRIAPRDTVSFIVMTTDQDNLKTAKHYSNLLNLVKKKITLILSTIHELDSIGGKRINPVLLMSAITKDLSYFKPLNLYYQKGKYPISFKSDEENAVFAGFQDMLNRYKSELSRVLQVNELYYLPIYRIETLQGIRTSAKVVPYLGMYIAISDVPPDMYSKTAAHFFPLIVPETYGYIWPLEKPKLYNGGFEVFIKKPGKELLLEANQFFKMEVKAIVDTKEGKTISVNSDTTIIIKPK
jgi:hypothetical protein